MDRQKEWLECVNCAKQVLKRGDRIRVTKCPGRKRTITFNHWDGPWIVSKSGINDYAATSIDMVNGKSMSFKRPQIMWKSSQFSDGKPGLYKMEFQGRLLKSCMDLVFWFLWGDYTFDIREVRNYLGKKDDENTLDRNCKLDGYKRFRHQMQELIDMVGDRDFEEVLLHVACKVNQRNQRIIAENEASANQDTESIQKSRYLPF